MVKPFTVDDHGIIYIIGALADATRLQFNTEGNIRDLKHLLRKAIAYSDESGISQSSTEVSELIERVRRMASD